MKLSKGSKIGILVLMLLCLGKIVGLLRDMIFSMYFGTSVEADAYFTANLLPNIINMTFVMSALVFFIPIYNKVLVEKGKEEAQRFTSNLMNVFVTSNIILSLISFIFAPLVVKLIAPGLSISVYEISVELSRLMVLSFPVTTVVHVLINLSNANQRHLFPQSIPVLNGFITIILMLVYVPKYGIYSVPLIGLFAWFVQIFIQGYLLRDKYKFQLTFDIKDRNIKKILRLSLPVIISNATIQINLAIDTVWASTLGSGSISVINYAQKIFNLLNGTIVLAIITLSYPILSKLYGSRKYDVFLASINKYLKVIIYVMIPVIIISFICSDDIVKIIYLRGNFNLENAKLVSDVFKIYLLSVACVGINEFYTRIFYITGDSLTPTKSSIVGILINIILNTILISKIGVFGIALSTTISSFVVYFLNKIFLIKKLKNKTGTIIKKHTRTGIVTMGIGLLVITIATNLLYNQISNYDSILKLLITSLIVLVMYLIFLYISKNEILDFVIINKNKNNI